jgi:hypothetical protein
MSRNALEDTDVPAPMEIMMAGSSEDICLLDCSLQSPGIHSGPGAAPRWEGGARAVRTRDISGAAPSRERMSEPRGYMTASELPSAR